jgi:hypothetical protein
VPLVRSPHVNGRVPSRGAAPAPGVHAARRVWPCLCTPNEPTMGCGPLPCILSSRDRCGVGAQERVSLMVSPGKRHEMDSDLLLSLLCKQSKKRDQGASSCPKCSLLHNKTNLSSEDM